MTSLFDFDEPDVTRCRRCGVRFGMCTWCGRPADEHLIDGRLVGHDTGNGVCTVCTRNDDEDE